MKWGKDEINGTSDSSWLVANYVRNIATDNKLGIPVGFSAQRRRRYKHFCPQWGMASPR